MHALVLNVSVPKQLWAATGATMGQDLEGRMTTVGFQKGQSGNPNGRPVGARNKTTLAIEALLGGEAEAFRWVFRRGNLATSVSRS